MAFDIIAAIVVLSALGGMYLSHWSAQRRLARAEHRIEQLTAVTAGGEPVALLTGAVPAASSSAVDDICGALKLVDDFHRYEALGRSVLALNQQDFQ